MPQRELINPTGLVTPLGPYSHASRFGDLLFVAGQLALDNETGKPLADLDIAAQTRKVLENIKTAVESVGSSMDNVLKTTVYLTTLDNYAEMNAVYHEFFPNGNPARATVQVAGLIGGLVVEIDAVAAIP